MKRVGEIIRKTVVKEIKEGVEASNSSFLFNYSKVSGLQMNDFRKDCADAGGRVFVAKNRLSRLALKDLKLDELAERLDGQTAFVYGDGESVDMAKLVVKFAKECEEVKVCGGLLDGKVLDDGEVTRLSELPSKEVLQAQLLAAIQSPVSRLMQVLNGKTTELFIYFEAIK